MNPKNVKAELAGAGRMVAIGLAKLYEYYEHQNYVNKLLIFVSHIYGTGELIDYPDPITTVLGIGAHETLEEYFLK